MKKIWHSIFWKLLSCACFAGTNIIVRYLSGGSPISTSTNLPIYSIIFFQNLIGLSLISLAAIWRSPRQIISIWYTDKLWRHLARIATAGSGIAVWYLSLRYISVTEAVALSFIAPILTTIAAICFLKENFNWQRKFAVSLSILGGVLITRPDLTIIKINHFNWYLLLPLVSAIIFSLDKIFTRSLLTNKETPQVLTNYLLLSMSIFALVPCFLFGWHKPDLIQLPWLVLLGLLGIFAHYAFNKAHALAELTFLLPFGAAKIIMCAILSYIVFYEIPNTSYLWIGIITMTFSTIILNLPADLFVKRVKAHA